MSANMPLPSCLGATRGGSLCFTVVLTFICLMPLGMRVTAQQPPQPVDIRPIDGETYYVVNQLTGLQLDGGLSGTENPITQQDRSFTSTGQRWGFVRVFGDRWKIKNVASGLCLSSAEGEGERNNGRRREEDSPEPQVISAPCHSRTSQIWTLRPTSNGFYTLKNLRTGRVAGVGDASAAGSPVTEAHRFKVPEQSAQWLIRPVFFRGIDNALLEKQEAARIAAGLSWWKDAGQQEDVLAILRDHGINMVRVRPSSAPPYANPSQSGCVGNLCFAETEEQDLDLARRARNLGMSLQLTLLFDGGRSSSVPASWANHPLDQLEADIYQYTKAEILKYRQAGVMPDLVAIGNEVDTGFLGRTGSPTGARFGNFAALQSRAIQAVHDAAADTSAGPALPAPLTCIHITPAWNLTDFFTLADQNGISYDAICQSFYPLFHGPLTAAQSAQSNPFNKPVEQDVLIAAAHTLGKPIFIIETGEHYENGFLANDPWYPPSVVNQRQFLLDLQSVLKNIPGNLAMGMEYWDATGINIPNGLGGFFNGGDSPDSIYIWNGLTLFNNADGSGTTNAADPAYSELLPAIDAVGGKLDPSLTYKFALFGARRVLSIRSRHDHGDDKTDVAGFVRHNFISDIRISDANISAVNTIDSRLSLIPDAPELEPEQQWIIQSNGDGFFQIRNASAGNGSAIVLSNKGQLTEVAPPDAGPEQEWDIVSAAHGLFRIVNRVNGQSLKIRSGRQPEEDGTGGGLWKIVPVR